MTTIIRLIVIGFILFQRSLVFSQVNTDDISIELRYPMPMGNNFLNKALGKGYMGLFDIGIDCSLQRMKNYGFGIVLNSSILNFFTDMNLFVISPKIKFDYTIATENSSIIYQLAFGYSAWLFRSTGMSYNDEDKFKENRNGLTAKLSMKFVIYSNWYLQLAYEFTRLEKPEMAIDCKYTRNIHLLYPGIGIIWRPDNI